MSSQRLVIMAVVGVFSSANADLIFVDGDNCPGPGSGMEGDPYCSIQTAIDNAVHTDEIVVAPGTYFETINLLGKAIWLHSSDGPDVTVIDAQSAGTVVTCDTGEGSDTVLEGFTVTGGTGTNVELPPGSGDFFPVGGGMYNDNNSNSTVSDCTFSDNTADLGGGMYSDNNSSPTVSDCTFSGNTVFFAGGGMYNDNNSNPTVSGCTFDGNSACDGGGMYSLGGSSPTVTACTFSGNLSLCWGGGMLNGQRGNATVIDCSFINNTALITGGGMVNTHSSDPTVKNCSFIGNTAPRGGGMVNRQFSMPMVTNCTFEGNSVSAQGGGMHNIGGSPTVTNCTFIGNSAGLEGGGMHTRNNPTVTNCTFTGNFAGVDGGGIYSFASSATVTNCTFSGNEAVNAGGGMYNLTSSPTVTNCTFALNSATNGQALAFDSVDQQFPSDFTMTNCIVWNGGDGIWNNDGSPLSIAYSDLDGGWPGIGNINADPMFVDPDNGDFRLQPGSPCIDAGHNNAIADLTDTDLDGNPRFADDPATADTGCGVPVVVDMGAYEYQGVPATVVFADLNGDGAVDDADVAIMIACLGSDDQDCCIADLNLDGRVGIRDLLLIGSSGVEFSPVR